MDSAVAPNYAASAIIGCSKLHGNVVIFDCHAAWYRTRHNAIERGRKMAILHRRNSLFYKTARGAQIGDIFMSLIHTCELNQINPFEYLMALQRHAAAVAKSVAQWLPWSYLKTLQELDSG